MNVLKNLGIGIAILIIIFIVAGFLLPSEYKVSRSIEVQTKANIIYPHINDLQEWKKWGVWFKRDPNMTLTYTGTAGETGHSSTWKSESQGNGQMILRKAEPDHYLEYDLLFPDMGMASIGTITLDEKQGRTTVTWTDEGDVGSDLVGRYFLLFIDDMLGPDFEAGLQNLKTLAEKQ